MNVSVQVDTGAFNDAVRRYVKELRVGMPEALRTQSRLLFGRIIQRTYPKTRAEGRRRVQKDILRAVEPLEARKWKDKGIKRLIRERKYDDLQVALENARPGYRAKVVQFSPRLHQESRDGRGRVRPTGFVSPDANEIKAYIKGQQEHVGRAKGGFAAALIASGGRPSDWVARWAKVGTVEDRLNDPITSFIRSENRSEWASHGDDQRIVAEALQSRSRDIVKDIEKRLERAAKASSP